MKFKYLENVAIADTCFEAYGKTLNEMFENSALAVSDCMVNLKEIKQKVKREIKLESDKLDNLLYDFLSEIVYIKDTDGLLFSKYKVIVKEGKKFTLNATCYGDIIRRDKQELRNDVKAITMHMFEIKKEKNKYQSTVVVDI
jgi:SHS2 domain-containing protein